MTACGEQLGPSFGLPGEKNPKLSSQLNQLVRAETQGEAASFARKNNIVLADERVRVIVESEPGQLEAAIKAASCLGSVETTYDDQIQAVVPVSSLAVLAEAESIRLVRLPQEAVPGPAKGGGS